MCPCLIYTFTFRNSVWQFIIRASLHPAHGLGVGELLYMDATHRLVGTREPMNYHSLWTLVITVFWPPAASKHTTQDVNGTQIYELLLLLIRTLFAENHSSHSHEHTMPLCRFARANSCEIDELACTLW